jgi:hypothetical protein
MGVQRLVKFSRIINLYLTELLNMTYCCHIKSGIINIKGLKGDIDGNF